MGVLKFSLVGRWKNLPNSYPSALELEEWARTTWRLKGSLMVAFLNTDMMLLEFALPEEAKWVIESGRRWLWGGSLNLDWWSPDFGCVTSKEVVEEAWIWVVGLPLHLRSFFFFFFFIGKREKTFHRSQSIQGVYKDAQKGEERGLERKGIH